ncbi:MAG: FtsX-like permease family protein, partial [Bacteroidia bacterium]|nr:FtsX-like permease family protein [Bacteroidia bacterium]
NVISWISLIAITFTTAAFIIIISVMNGFTSVVSNLYNAAEPDLKISLATGKYFYPDTVLKKLKDIKEIKCISKSIYNQALIKYQQRQMIVSIRGVDTAFEKVTQINTLLQKGKFQLKDKNTNNLLVIGNGIANEMNINITHQFNPIILYSPKRIKNTGTNTDLINELPAYVSGIFSINDDFDYKYIFCDLNFAQNLFDAEKLITTIEVSIDDPNKKEETQKIIQHILGKNFVVKTKEQLNEVLFKTLQTEKLWTFVILSFILIIATFSIISALTMLIIEKQKDIQTLYALGANKQLIESIFMAEGFLITFGGAFAGLIVGIIVCWIQIQFHVIKFNENSILPYYPVELQVQDIFMVLVVLLIIGFLAAIYPVRFFTKEIKWRR